MNNSLSIRLIVFTFLIKADTIMIVVRNMKRNKQRYNITTTTELDYTRVIKITVGVLIVFILVYLVTAYGMGEIKLGKDDKVSKETAIQYDEIIGGNVFNRSSNEYYVLFYDFNDNYASYYQSLIRSYISKDNSLPVYLVDLSKKINEEYKLVEDDTNKYSKADLSNLKVTDPTLLKIVKGKTTEVVEGKDKVIESLQNK